MIPIDDNRNLLYSLIRLFYRGTLDYKFSNCDIKGFTWSKQEEFIKATINSDLVRKYPLNNKFVKLFIKKLIGYLEPYHEVHDSLYEYLCMTMAADTDQTHYRHYIIGNDILEHNMVTLKETNNIVVNGTTGMKTWEAALMLADWAISNKVAFEGKTILEFGSGIGFTGIAISKYCHPHAVFMSDCHIDVLNRLSENVLLNFPNIKRIVSSNCSNEYIIPDTERKIGVLNLDWTKIESLSIKILPDVIIGADVVYDPLILQHLCNVLKYFLNKNNNIEVYIAGVMRNESTFNDFLQRLESYEFKYQVTHMEQSVFVEWDHNVRPYLIKINKVL